MAVAYPLASRMRTGLTMAMFCMVVFAITMMSSWLHNFNRLFLSDRSLGGFSVMNADDEWNDARQSLFAELILRYGEELHLPEYVHRGLAALRSSFIMMYCPENPETRAQWEKVYPFFNEKDYGFMMENYGHGGEANANGLGIGEFTIYDWGNGAASEAYLRVMDHFGADYLKQ